MTQQPQRLAPASSAGQLQPGTAVDHFEVIRLLGRGLRQDVVHQIGGRLRYAPAHATAGEFILYVRP